MACPQGGDREGSRAACRDPDDDIVGTNLCVDDGLRACGLVVLGPLDTANECVKTAGNDKDDPVGWPVIGRQQFASVLHPDARRSAGTASSTAAATEPSAPRTAPAAASCPSYMAAIISAADQESRSA